MKNLIDIMNETIDRTTPSISIEKRMILINRVIEIRKERIAVERQQNVERIRINDAISNFVNTFQHQNRFLVSTDGLEVETVSINRFATFRNAA